MINLEDPLPEEAFYSVVARTRDTLMYTSAYHMNEVILGSSEIRPSIDLPTHIDRIVERLPPNTLYSADYFRLNNTLFSLYFPFLTSSRQNALVASMRGNGRPSPNTIVGRSASGITHPDHLLYCPSCSQEDEEEYGEPYWHRLHQAPGVLVCPKHAVWLENSQIATKNLRLFYSAENNIHIREPRPLDLARREDRVLLGITLDIQWLLQNSHITSDSAELRQRYMMILADKGYATYAGNVYSSSLCEAFNDYYSGKFLRSLGCELEGHYKRNWLTRIVKSEQVHHPLRHLLLIQFLELSAREFFSYPLDFAPFGVGPWPCLNPACPQYKQSVIEKCHIGFSHYSGRTPVGTFSCACGFTYTRIGPDKTQDDRERIGKIRDYGPVWDEKLMDLWLNSDMTLNEIRSVLGCGIDRLRAQAKRLKLPSRGRYIALKTEAPSRTTYGDIPTEEITASYRQAWLSLIEMYPNLGAKELQKLSPKVYRWLDRHDRQWLNLNTPDARFGPIEPKVDWALREDGLIETAADARAKLLSSCTPPIRITNESISRELGFKRGLKKRDLQKMPRLKEFFEQNTETLKEFAARCGMSSASSTDSRKEGGAN